MCGVLFGTWPLFGRRSGITPPWMGIVVAVLTAIIVVCGVRTSDVPKPQMNQIMLCALGGIANGFGMLIVIRLVGDPKVGLIPLTIIGVTIPFVSTVVAVLFFHESLTATRAAGLALACVAVWLLQ